MTLHEKIDSYEQRKDTRERIRIDLDQQRYAAWLIVEITRQTYGERLTLVEVTWKLWTKSANEPRPLYGPSGNAYWIPAREDRYTSSPGKVYSWIETGSSSYLDTFDTADTFTPDDLLNVAAASWDGKFWPHAIDSTRTNPFRPYEFDESEATR